MTVENLKDRWVGKTVGCWFNEDAVVTDVKPYDGAFDFIVCVFTLTTKDEERTTDMSIDTMMMDQLERTGRL